MDIPKIKVPDIVGKIGGSDAVKSRRRSEDRQERALEYRLLFFTCVAIVAYIAVAWIAVSIISNQPLSIEDVVRGSMGSVFALFFAVIILDNINSRNDKRKRRREERRAIVRHNKIIQPVIDMYLVRKNMVITPNDKTIRKFQVNSKFTVKDMKDMYSLSDLISDVGKTKIEVYAYYQEKLNEVFTHLVEDVDFNFYSELSDAALEYISATAYGASALDAVIGYRDTLTGTKSMKSMVLNMIREESENGKFIDAPPALKNVYLVNQMINDQSVALAKYLKLVRGINAEEDKSTGASAQSKEDYE